MTSVKNFDELNVPTPSLGVLKERYEKLVDSFANAQGLDEEMSVFQQWQGLDDEVSTWSSLTTLKFSQDTTDQVRKQENDFKDELMPQLQEYDVRLKKMMLESEHRAAHEEKLGKHLFNLWEVDVVSFDPQIQDELIALNKLAAEYTELQASATIEFQGETYNLSQLRKFSGSPDRDVRRSSEYAKWSWYTEHGEEFDRIYDEMVKLRHQAATKLGYKDFVELGYKLMRRTDYSRLDVEKFRQEVLDVVVPFCQELRSYQKNILGVDELKVWDLGLFAPEGNPEPKGDAEWMVERAREMFHEMGHGLGEFFDIMADKGYLDLDSRAGKAGGGFCTSFASEKVPFIFANFNGTEGDVRVFTHEMGHAFQYWNSADYEAGDYYWPTYEAAEIHSMSLEFLTWPHMEKFFGDEDAERFRMLHLIEGIIFLPYGVAVDHFQHMVYENPEATPEERRQMWSELEKKYLPWVDWDEIEHGKNGGRWHGQLHIFHVPFYYIDYTLAQACALQFWKKSNEDFEGTMKTYKKVCETGGSLPFQSIVKSANLASPFEPGCLSGSIEYAREVLKPVLEG